jgi:tetratricopeptide (TPR) repeat protein
MEAETRSTKKNVFDGLLSAVRTSVCEQVVAAAQKEAARLKREEKLDEAIRVLESARALDPGGALLEYLCVYICDRGGVKLGKKDLAGARRDFEQALRLKPGFQRANQGMATTYNNEGCEERDHDRSIGLFEKALQYDPDNHVAKRNLGRELRGKAVDLVNAIRPPVMAYELTQPIALLERALTYVGSNLKSDALSSLRVMASLSPDMAKGLLRQVNDEDVRKVLDDLITLYSLQKRVRGY